MSYSHHSIEQRCQGAMCAIGLDPTDKIHSKDQLKIFLQQAGENPSKETIDKLWSEKSGPDMSLQDCIKIVEVNKKTAPQQSDELKAAFKAINSRNAKLTLNQLEVILGQALRNEGLSPADLRRAFGIENNNGNQTIDLDRFITDVQSTTQKTLDKNMIILSEHDRKAKADRSRTNSRTKEHRSDSTASSSKLSSQRKSSTKSGSSQATKTKAPDILSIKSHAPSTSTISTEKISQNQIQVRFSAPKEVVQPRPDETNRNFHEYRKGAVFIDERISTDEPLPISNQFELFLPNPEVVSFTIQPLINCDMPSKANDQCSDMVLYLLDKNDDKIVACTDNIGEGPDGKLMSFGNTHLEAGQYILMAFMTPNRFQTLKQVGQEGARRAELIDTDRKLTKKFKSVLMNIFDVFDIDNNGLLSREEISMFNNRTSAGEEDHIAEAHWEAIKGSVDTKNDEITMKGFLALHQLEADDPEGDIEDMWSALYNAGYDDNLQMSRAWPYNIEVSCDTHNATLTMCNQFEYMFRQTVTQQLYWDYWWSQSDNLNLLTDQIRLFKMGTHAICLNRATKRIKSTNEENLKSIAVDLEGHQQLIFVSTVAAAEKWSFNIELDQ